MIDVRITDKRFEQTISLRKQKKDEINNQRRFKNLKIPKTSIIISELDIDPKYKDYKLKNIVSIIFLIFSAQ
jgi:hypothetical protein